MNLSEPWRDDPARRGSGDAQGREDRISIQIGSGEPTQEATAAGDHTKRSSQSPSLQKRKKSKPEVVPAKSHPSAVSMVHTPPRPTRKESTKREKEVDFYRNPTILSRLVLNQRYAAAVKRVHRYPEETATWVCVKRRVKKLSSSSSSSSKKQRSSSTPKASTTKTTMVNTLRQLPIHMACGNLCRTKDSELKKSLNELITSLVVANPKGSFQPDHEGRLAIFDALQHGVAVETMSIFLMADPNAIDLVDPKTNQTLPEANQLRTGENKEEIKGLLSLGSAFWQRAHEEAELRLRTGGAGATPKYPSRDTQASEGYSSTLPVGDPDTETIVSADSGDIQPLADDTDDDSTVQSISWHQLEDRAIAMEQLLTEMNEKNFELHRRIDELSQIKSTTKEVQALHKENLELSEKLQLLQTIMERTVGMPGPDDEESVFSAMSNHSDHPVAARYNALYARHQQQRDCIRILQHAFQALASTTQSEDDEEEAYSDDGGTGRASSITWSTFSSLHDSAGAAPAPAEQQQRAKTSGGEDSAESQPKQQRTPRREDSAPRQLPWTPSPVATTRKQPATTAEAKSDSMEVQWTPDRPDRSDKTLDLDKLRTSIGQSAGEVQEDSLSVLFRAAASGDDIMIPQTPEGGQREAPPPAISSDNLSGMFRREAAREQEEQQEEEGMLTEDDLSAMLRQAAIDPDQAAPSQDELSAMWRQAAGSPAGRPREEEEKDEDLSAILAEGTSPTKQPSQSDLSAIWREASAVGSPRREGEERTPLPDDLSAVLRRAAATSDPDLHQPLRARPSKDDLSTMLRAAARCEVTVASGQVSTPSSQRHSASETAFSSVVAPEESEIHRTSDYPQRSRMDVEPSEESDYDEGRWVLEEEIMRLSGDSSIDAGSPGSSI